MQADCCYGDIKRGFFASVDIDSNRSFPKTTLTT